jgi:hypothetical protein
VAAFSAYALNGLFASLVPGFTTVMLHHSDYAVAGGVTCVFFAAGAVAALGLAPFNSRPVLLGGLGLFLVGLVLVVAKMSAASLALFLVGAVVAGAPSALWSSAACPPPTGWRRPEPAPRRSLPISCSPTQA